MSFSRLLVFPNSTCDGKKNYFDFRCSYKHVILQVEYKSFSDFFVFDLIRFSLFQSTALIIFKIFLIFILPFICSEKCRLFYNKSSYFLPSILFIIHYYEHLQSSLSRSVQLWYFFNFSNRWFKLHEIMIERICPSVG